MLGDDALRVGKNTLQPFRTKGKIPWALQVHFHDSDQSFRLYKAYFLDFRKGRSSCVIRDNLFASRIASFATGVLSSLPAGAFKYWVRASIALRFCWASSLSMDGLLCFFLFAPAGLGFRGGHGNSNEEYSD